MTSSPTTPTVGLKRAHEPDESQPDTSHDAPVSPNHRDQVGSSANTSNFRNVSACNRCRLRKNRCDQRLPSCTACEKVKHRCVGFDPITKQEIPRSYVYYLESRVSYCEGLLQANNINFDPGDAFDDGAVRGLGQAQSTRTIVNSRTKPANKPQAQEEKKEQNEKTQEAERLDKIVDDIGMVTVHGASDRRYLGSTSGISFARVVLAAVKSSVAASSSEKWGTRPSQPPKIDGSGGASSIRDSYFGLSTKPTIREAPFPDRPLGDKLVRLYFEHANPQIPVLHREEFMKLYNHAYSRSPQDRTPKELYFLNIVFAIGAGVIFGSSGPVVKEPDDDLSSPKRSRLSAMTQAQPEEYHASAIVHLSAFLSASSLMDGQDKTGGDLEDLQAVLLLAGFAVLRPVAPGLWYIVGVAMRLAIDLGLHFESGLGSEYKVNRPQPNAGHHRRQSYFAPGIKDRNGKQEWLRDLRRRLWWCTYCLDRMVSVCVGRPFGITDVVVTTEFPSLLDDKYITRNGIQGPLTKEEPSYKLVAIHYLKLRLLQSEILQVLQYQQAQQARFRGVNKNNPHVHKDVPSPFLVRYPDFHSWRIDMDQRLWEWKESGPTDAQTGVGFPVQFLELNYWQAIITLYRNSLSIPDQLANETSPTEEVTTPSSPPVETKEDQDIIFLKCAEAGQKTLKIYRQLHRRRLVNYTYLATHHIFMAGISFLYAIWHSPIVRRHLTLDDFDFTVLAATSVLGDLMEVCPPAEACRDALERMSKATVQMCMTTRGFGLGQHDQPEQFPFPQTSPLTTSMMLDAHLKDDTYASRQDGYPSPKRPLPNFDMDLRMLFPDGVDDSTRPSQSIPWTFANETPTKATRQNYGNTSNPYAPRSRSQVPQPFLRPETRLSIGETFPSNGPHQQQVPQLLSSLSHSAQPLSSSYVDINQNTYNPDFMSNLPGLDFLNSLTRNPASEMFAGTGNSMRVRGNVPSLPGDDTATVSGSIDHTFDGTTRDSMMDYGNFAYSPAFSFGDNVGFDFNQQHDWGNGQNGFDLFNGFFFDRNGS